MADHLIDLAKALRSQALDPATWAEALNSLAALIDELATLETKDFAPAARADFAKCKAEARALCGNRLGTADSRAAISEFAVRLQVVLSQYKPEPTTVAPHDPGAAVPERSDGASFGLNVGASETRRTDAEEKKNQTTKFRASLKDGIQYERHDKGHTRLSSSSNRTIVLSIIAVVSLAALSFIVRHFFADPQRTLSTPLANDSASIYLNGLLFDGQTKTIGSVGYDRLLQRVEARVSGIPGADNVILQLAIDGKPVGEPFTIRKGSSKASVDLTSSPISCGAGHDLGVNVISNGGAADGVVTVSSQASANSVQQAAAKAVHLFARGEKNSIIALARDGTGLRDTYEFSGISQTGTFYFSPGTMLVVHFDGTGNQVGVSKELIISDTHYGGGAGNEVYYLENEAPNNERKAKANINLEGTNVTDLVILPQWLEANGSAYSEDGRLFLKLNRFEIQNGSPVGVLVQLSIQLPHKKPTSWYGFVMPPRETVNVGGLEFSVSVLKCESNRLYMAVECIS